LSWLIWRFKIFTQTLQYSVFFLAFWSGEGIFKDFHQFFIS
jgi:hypothetical protein